MSASPRVTVGDYVVDVTAPLGKGGFGTVYKGDHRASGISVALKQVNIKGYSLTKDADTEFKNLKSLKAHDNVILFLGAFVSKDNLWLITELCNGGDLADYYTKHNPNLPTSMLLMTQIASGIRHLHEHDPPIVHRDLKPANVLLNCDDYIPVVKITDFGLSKIGELGTFYMTTLGGTPPFMAPEFFGAENYTSAVDIFAMGLIFFGMINHKENPEMAPFFKTKKGDEWYKYVVTHSIQDPKDDDGRLVPYGLAQYISKEFDLTRAKLSMTIGDDATIRRLVNLMGCMISVDPKARPRCEIVEGAIKEVTKLRKISDAEIKEKLKNQRQDFLKKGSGRVSVVSITSGQENDLNTDDVVEFCSTLEEAIAAQDEKHGGWTPLMTQFLGKRAEVKNIAMRSSGHQVVQVVFLEDPLKMKWWINPVLLKKADEKKFSLQVGNFVNILENEEKLKIMQSADHGGWNSEMNKLCGKRARIVHIFDDGDIKVSVSGKSWTLNRKAVTGVSETPPSSDSDDGGDGNPFDGQLHDMLMKMILGMALEQTKKT